MLEQEYFPHLMALSRCLIDGKWPDELLQDDQLRHEIGTDLKELLTVVSILYRREEGLQALAKFREPIQLIKA